MNSGFVHSLFISREKGKNEEVFQAKLIENFGFEGDIHSGDEIKQILLFPLESIEALNESFKNAKGLCQSKFKENIVTKGIDISNFSIGTRIKIGSSILEVSKIGKGCFKSECNYYIENGPCKMAKDTIYLVVIKGGIICKNDIIKIL